jgi:glycosyltransferase involved in cell wall biosynthesis
MIVLMYRSKKYSIILPVYNGIKYLPTCVNTIIQQEYNDYELIISNDGSTDATEQYLETLHDHPNIKIIQPSERLSMTEHWEWALSHASGEWMIFVGQDDGLQHYFFELADKLTDMASEKNIRAITSSRAYYFWTGCEYVYGDVAVKYRAMQKFEVLNTKYEAFKALLGFQEYFDLPQMYTNSMFHKSLVEEAKSRQNEKLFSSHPQDANLAAVSCSIEDKYLKSYIPLGWIGTSPKSAGMAIFSDENKVKEEDREAVVNLKKEYEKKVSDSALKYHELAGSFSLGSLQVYFWQALLKTGCLRDKRTNNFLMSKKFRFLLLSSALNEVKRFKKDENIQMMYEVILKNGFNVNVINISSIIAKLFIYMFYAQKGIKKIFRVAIYKQVSRYVSQKDNQLDTLEKISKEIKLEVQNNIMQEKVKCVE